MRSVGVPTAFGLVAVATVDQPSRHCEPTCNRLRGRLPPRDGGRRTLRGLGSVLTGMQSWDTHHRRECKRGGARHESRNGVGSRRRNHISIYCRPSLEPISLSSGTSTRTNSSFSGRSCRVRRSGLLTLSSSLSRVPLPPRSHTYIRDGGVGVVGVIRLLTQTPSQRLRLLWPKIRACRHLHSRRHPVFGSSCRARRPFRGHR